MLFIKYATLTLPAKPCYVLNINPEHSGTKDINFQPLFWCLTRIVGNKYANQKNQR